MMSLTRYIPQVATDGGQVKVNDGNGVIPGWRFGDADSIDNQWQPITYTAPLGLSSFPTTSWPQTVALPSDSDLYDFTNDTFLENPILGQTHLWRIVFEFFKAQGPNTDLFFEIRNTLSGFTTTERLFVAIEGIAIRNIVSFLTIADGASLPPPLGTGQGYEIRVQAGNNLLQSDPGTYLIIPSITRVSLHYSFGR